MLRSIRFKLFVRASNHRISSRISARRSTSRSNALKDGESADSDLFERENAGTSDESPDVSSADIEAEYQSSEDAYYTYRNGQVKEEAYGNEYGAGPSRIPFVPHTPPHFPKTPPPGKVPIAYNEMVRFPLKQQPTKSQYECLNHIKRVLGVSRISAKDVEWMISLSRTEFHRHFRRIHVVSLVDHLVARGKPLLAAELIHRFVSDIKPEWIGSEGLFRRSTITHVFTAATGPVNFRERLEPGIRLQPRGTDDLDILLPLLRELQRIRNPRDLVVYEYLIQRCCAEGLYDTAAKIYVELAEEWITEGRMALGADPASFYEGGGPPREGRENWEFQSGLYKTWWKGVRTWVLPGEVLSPHDRLDLWHPRKLRLPERLRKFPMPTPTAPPSIVPHPTFQMLTTMADHLQLDPDKASPEAFERSMRACAILASTILSRTMPYLPSRILRDILGSTPMHPAVYPENYNGPKHGNDAWAYTAYTHIHLAIRSVLLSPPTRPGLYQYMVAFDQARTEGKPLPEIPERYRYKTAPMSFPACIFLAVYAFKKLRNVDVVIELYKYARNTWSMFKITALHNVILRGAAKLKKNALALHFDNLLFGKSQLAINGPNLSPVRTPRSMSDFEKQAEKGEFDKQWIIPNRLGGEHNLNMTTLDSFLQYLIDSSQHDRFTDTVYRIMPHLQYSRMINQELMGDPLEIHRAENGRFRSVPVAPLTPRLYTTILQGLESSGSTVLAHRVFLYALGAQSKWNKQFPANEPLPRTHQLEPRTYSIMMGVWYKFFKNNGTMLPLRRVTLANQVPEELHGPERRKEAVDKAWTVYTVLRLQWKRNRQRSQFGEKSVEEIAEQEDRAKPLPELWDTLIGMRKWVWGFGDDVTTPPQEIHMDEQRQSGWLEMRDIASDITGWGYDLPLFLSIRLGKAPPLSQGQVDKMTEAQLGDCFRIPRRGHDGRQPQVPRRPRIEVELASFPEMWAKVDETQVELRVEQRVKGSGQGKRRSESGVEEREDPQGIIA